MSYYVFKCKKCGRWSSKEIRTLDSAVFKCPYCQHQEKIKKKSDFGLSMVFKGPFKNPNKAVLVAQEENKKGERNV